MNLAVEEASSTADVESMRILRFRLADNEFAVDAEKVRAVVRAGPIARLPATPEYFHGLIAFEDSVTPVIDPRDRLESGGESPGGELRRILIVDGNDQAIGLLVDDVGETTTIRTSEIDAATGASEQDFIVGRVRCNNCTVALVNLERVVASCPLTPA